MHYFIEDNKGKEPQLWLNYQEKKKL